MNILIITSIAIINIIIINIRVIVT